MWCEFFQALDFVAGLPDWIYVDLGRRESPETRAASHKLADENLFWCSRCMSFQGRASSSGSFLILHLIANNEGGTSVSASHWSTGDELLSFRVGHPHPRFSRTFCRRSSPGRTADLMLKPFWITGLGGKLGRDFLWLQIVRVVLACSFFIRWSKSPGNLGVELWESGEEWPGMAESHEFDCWPLALWFTTCISSYLYSICLLH